MSKSPARAALTPFTLMFLVVPPLFWAGNTVVGKMASGVIPPITLNFLRWLIAVLLLLPFVWPGLRRDWPVIRKHLGFLSITALLSITSFNALQYLALNTSSAMNIALISAAGPIFILLIGRVCFATRITSMASFGALVSVLGVAWVLFRGDLANASGIHLVPGDLFMLFAIALWSFYTWLLRNKPVGISLYSSLTSQILLGILFSLPMVVAELSMGHYAPVEFNAKVWMILLYVAICPALLAYICWQQAVTRTGSALPMFFQNLTPVFAAVLSVIMLGEYPQTYHYIGLACIVVGILLANKK